jgi:hypothetical protein
MMINLEITIAPMDWPTDNFEGISNESGIVVRTYPGGQK